MKKNLWKSSILIGICCMLAFLPACGAGYTESSDGQVLVESVIPETVPDSIDESGETVASPANAEGKESIKRETDTSQTNVGEGEGKQESVSNQSSDSYRGVYKQIVTEKEDDGIVFSLIYLDADDIPELAVCDRGYDIYSIYTVKDGAAFCMIDAMNTVEMDYFEQKGVISQFARWNGGGEEGGYGWYYYQVSGEKTFVDDDLPTIHDTYDAVYDEKGNWTGEGVTKYYHMDQEIDEAAYQQMMNELGVVEGDGKSVADNAIGKAEMLNQLEQ